MKIRIHETDFEGHPVDCTGEYFSGKTALDIVEAMKMNPFNASLTPAAFMRRILDANGQKAFSLPDEPNKAAVAFLQRLAASGYASFEQDEGELDAGSPGSAALEKGKVLS